MTPQKPLINHQNPSSHLRRGWVFILLTFVCFGLLPGAKASDVDSALPNGNTADGDGALAGLTSGFYNSAFGFLSLLSNADASFNTGVGAGVLLTNTGSENTAVGAGALFSNTTGAPNTAVGAFALWFNTDGFGNNAVGDRALFNNVSADFNNAFGREALNANVDGEENDAFGDFAMQNNVSGSQNTAMGDDALRNCVDGSSNVAIGDEAGTGISSGSTNVVVGAGAGGSIGAGTGNVYVGNNVEGAADEIRFVRIGDTAFTDYDCFIAGIFGRGIDAGTAVIVGIDANQKLGTVLVDANGNKVPFKPQAMLDESLKQQKRIAELDGTVERPAAMVKEQATQIQKVSARLEVNKPAPQVVANKP